MVYCYHHQPHNGVNGRAPIKVYQQLVHGTDEKPGVGLPENIQDEETFRLDFTPFEMRTVQRHGVVMDHIQYFSPVLRKWVNAKDPDDRNKKRKFIFARDPRDISVIYFFDPDTETYCAIPYLNNTRPAISLWELNAALTRLREDHYSQIDEDSIFKGIKKMREVEEKAIEKTRLAKQQRASEKRKRRMAERRNSWQDVHKTKPVKPEVSVIPDEQENEDIQPFDDIQFS